MALQEIDLYINNSEIFIKTEKGDIYILRCVIGMTRNLLPSRCFPLSAVNSVTTKMHHFHRKELSQLYSIVWNGYEWF